MPTLFFFVLSVTQLLQHCNLLSIISNHYQLVLCSYALKFNQVGSVELLYFTVELCQYCLKYICFILLLFHFKTKYENEKNWLCNLFERYSLIECNTEPETQQLLSFHTAKELERNPQFQA